MMRVLRTSVWGQPHHRPLTVIVRQEDVRMPLEEVAPETFAEGVETINAFVVTDIFEMPDDVTIEDATRQGLERQTNNAVRESNMALSYFWYVSMLARVVPAGIMYPQGRAPLVRADLETVLRQVADHPRYQGQTIVMFDANGAEVTLKNGRVDA